MYQQVITQLFDNLLNAMYPIRLGQVENKGLDFEPFRKAVNHLLDSNLERKMEDHGEIVEQFLSGIPEVKRQLDEDVDAIFEGDPAAKSKNEIILTYPGFYAISAHRIAHLLYKLSIELIPRAITEHAHSKTGIDIHPGATIGERFFIDHGTGIVIGETTQIGNNVKLYQGVTLGALSIQGRNSTKKRHPTIEDDVVLYAQATILGGDTVVGKGSVIGGNVWLTTSVPAHSKVYYKAHVERIENDRQGHSFKIIQS